MALSKNSGALSPDLVKRFQSARQRWLDTCPASTSGTSITSTTSGATGPGASPAPTTSTGLTRFTSDDLLERLATLATTPRGPDSAPLTTYTTTSTEHGEVYTATREYVDWLRRKIPGYGVESAVSRPAAGGTAGGEGAKPRFKQHAPLDTGG